MSEGTAELENLRLEYSEVNNNRRHYSNLRFAVFSVYFAVLGGLVSVAFGIVEIKSPSQASIILGARIAGLLFTVIFFSFEILGELNLRHFGRVARELEDQLGCRQFKTKDFSIMPRAFYFTWGMYIVLILFWLLSILGGMMNYTELITIAIAIIGTVAAVYNIRLVVQAFKADHERRKKQATIEYAGQILREARSKIDARYRSRILTKEELSKLIDTPEDYAEWRNALGVFEHLAVGVNAGVYDKDILYRMSGSYIIELFSLVKPYVLLKREKLPFAYAEFEKLAIEFENRHKNRELILSAGNIEHSRV